AVDWRRASRFRREAIPECSLVARWHALGVSHLRSGRSHLCCRSNGSQPASDFRGPGGCSQSFSCLVARWSMALLCAWCSCGKSDGSVANSIGGGGGRRGGHAPDHPRLAPPPLLTHRASSFASPH